MRIRHGGLAEAYEGYYEEDREAFAEYDAYVRDEQRTATETVAVQSYESWLEDWCRERCLGDSPARRLEVYCEWNGILGYARTLYELATKGDIV